MSEDNVIILDVMTCLDIPPDRVLNSAVNLEFESVTIVGTLKNGETYLASSHGKVGSVHWDLSSMCHNILTLTKE